MLSDQLQEAVLAERTRVRYGMDTRGREQFAEIVLANLDGITKGLARTKLEPEEERAANVAVKAARDFLTAWAKKVGLRLSSLDVDPVAGSVSGKHGIRRHLVALYGHLDGQAGSAKAVSSLKLADQALMTGPKRRVAEARKWSRQPVHGELTSAESKRLRKATKREFSQAVSKAGSPTPTWKSAEHDSEGVYRNRAGDVVAVKRLLLYRGHVDNETLLVDPGHL